MRPVSAFSVMLLVVTACSSDRSSGVSYPPGTLKTITLSTTSADPLASAGETRSVTAVVADANGSVIPTPSLSWRTSAPAVATVVASGDGATITAVDDGTAIITGAAGAIEGTLAVTVRRRIVAIVLSGPDSIVVAGTTTQLTVIGRDARQQDIRGVTGATFTSSNGFSILVSPNGLVTALFSSFQPFNSTVTAMVVADGVTLTATKQIVVASPAPAVFDAAALMLPEDVRPEPVVGAGEGIIYFTVDGARVQFKLLWSLLTGPPLSAHIHGPDTDAGGVAPILVDLPLGNPATTNGVLTGLFTAADIRAEGGRPAISLDSLVTLMRSFPAAYVDMHTSRFGDGEIRGSTVRFR